MNYKYIMLFLLLSKISCGDDLLIDPIDENQTVESTECPVLISPLSMIDLKCQENIENICEIDETLLDVTIDCAICKENPEFKIYDRIIILYEKGPSRYSYVLDTLEFDDDYKAKGNMCFINNLKQSSIILNYRLIDNESDNEAWAFDNICAENVSRIEMNKVVTKHDFEERPVCNDLTKVIYSTNPATLDSTIIYNIDILVIGSAGWGVGVGARNIREYDFEKNVNDFIEDAINYSDSPCSGVHIYIRE